MNEFIPGFTTTDFRDRPNQCPYCAYQTAAATSVEPGHHSPKPGSASICFQCGRIALFDENLRLRWPTNDERLELMRSEQWPTIRRISRARKLEWEKLPAAGKRVAAAFEKQWGWMRGPRPANIVIKQKPRR